MKKIYNVNRDYIDVRLDKWFKRNVYEVPQSFIEKNIRKGKIKVNNKKTKSSYKLQKNDEVITLNINYIYKKNNKKLDKYIPTKKDLSFSSKIFIENNANFVVINKPAGIAVQSGTNSKKNILDILSQTQEFMNAKPYAVHRIDKETTGVLIVAKNRKFAQLFTSLFRIRKIHKTYLGIVLGEMHQNKGTLIDDLYYYESNKKIIHRAITHFKVIDSNNKYSLLKLNPETGRKHQLRKQLLIHGCPILGDTKYQILNKPINKKSSLMLHAYEIYFSINNVKYNFLAEPPAFFINTLKEKYLKTF